jgi:transcriptional regulator with XRE-family HTH domain
MGKGIPKRPLGLAGKLKMIRESLGLSQGGILIKLGYQETTLTRSSISGYELGEREPPILVLYAYANLANVYMEVIVDDDLDLPETIPSDEKSLRT